MLSLMADTETLALHDNAVILQIGLVAFDENFNIVGQLDMRLDIASSLMDGFESDPKTARDFWGKQPAEVTRSVMYDQPRLPPKDAARVIDRWMKETFKGEFTICANGILFDIPKLDKFMTRYGMKGISERTKYNRVYDFRTMRSVAKQLFPKELEHAESIMVNNMQHNAISDCMWQIGMMDAIMAILGGKYQILDESADTQDAFLNPPITPDDPNEATWDDPEPDSFMEHVLGASQLNG